MDDWAMELNWTQRRLETQWKKYAAEGLKQRKNNTKITKEQNLFDRFAGL